MNEYGSLTRVAVRGPKAAYRDAEAIASEWEALRFHSPPELSAAETEHAAGEERWLELEMRREALGRESLA